MSQFSDTAVLENSNETTRRRKIDPTTCERDYSNEEMEFMDALDLYKRKSGRMFPTCSEILEVVRDLPIHQDYRLLLKKEPHQLDHPKVLDQEQ